MNKFYRDFDKFKRFNIIIKNIKLKIFVKLEFLNLNNNRLNNCIFSRIRDYRL